MSTDSDSDRTTAARGIVEGTQTSDDSGRAALGRRAADVYGGIKWGSAFFGWLTATGTALLLTALVAAIGTAGGLTAIDGLGLAPDQAQSPEATAGLVSAVVLLAVLFIAYFCGGYVAGRMARFNGAKQGIAVWLWAVFVAAAVAVLGTVAGLRFDLLANVNGLPRLPVDANALSADAIVVALVALAASLVGAVFGGLAGMRFHRRVDRSGLDR